MLCEVPTASAISRMDSPALVRSARAVPLLARRRAPTSWMISLLVTKRTVHDLGTQRRLVDVVKFVDSLGNVWTTRTRCVHTVVMADPPHKTAILWPDPDVGPWLVQVWWRAQHGVPTPVGISLTSWADDPEASGAHQLPRGTDEVALPRLDGQVVRALPVGQVLDRARRQLRDQLAAAQATAREQLQAVDERNTPARHAVAQARLQTVVERTSDLRVALDSGRRGRDLGDEHYREVAVVYARALQEGRRPTKAVQEHFTVEKSTAAKKVARARERGFLPKTTRGRVGQVTEGL